MTEFARLASLARLAVDAVHGEAATLLPVMRGKGPHGSVLPSTERPEASLVAAFFQDTEREAKRRAQPMIGQTGDRMLHRSPEIFASTAYTGDIAVGDRLRRERTGLSYEVATIDPDGVGSRILGLYAIRSA